MIKLEIEVHSKEDVERIKEAVHEARAYLNQLDDERNERIRENRMMMGLKVDRKKLSNKLQKIEA